MDRIHRLENAKLVRFRWYGDEPLVPEKEIWIERKVHHEVWSIDQSAKERAKITNHQTWDYMKGTFAIDQHCDDLLKDEKNERKRSEVNYGRGILTEVDKLIQDRQMQPMIRTSYYRCAFQSNTNNEIRVSLDTQLTFVDEYKANGHPEQPWCRQPQDFLNDDQVYRFPFAVLEVKLQGTKEAPIWMQKILKEVEAIQVHKFSKYQHAMAFLHPEFLPIFPHWYDDFVREAEKLVDEDSFVDARGIPKPDVRCAPLVHGSKLAGGGHEVKDMELIEPKAVLANERVLLHYAEKAAYLGTLSVVLLNIENDKAQLLGCMLAPLTTTYLLWAYLAYRARLTKLKDRWSISANMKARFDVVGGPFVVTVLLVAVLAMAVSLPMWDIRFKVSKHLPSLR